MIAIALTCALFYLSSGNRLLLQYGNVYNQYPQYNPYQNYNPYQTYNPYQQQQYSPYQQYNPYQQQYNPQPQPQTIPQIQPQPYPNTNPVQQVPNTPPASQTPPVSPQTPPATNTPPASGTTQTPPVLATPGYPSNQPQPITPGVGLTGAGPTPPVPFGRAIYPGGLPGLAIGGFVPPMAELICDQPAGMIGSCANGRTTISNVIDQFKMNCNAMGSCQNADVTMNLNGMGVRAVEGIWCSEPGSCAGANLKIRNTAGGNNVELSRLECSNIGSCNGLTLDVAGISVNDLDCPQPENCMGCTVIDRMDFPPVPKPCFGW